MLVKDLPSVMRMQPSGYVLYASCSHKGLNDMPDIRRVDDVL
jgi:hypothetical protein